MFGWNKIFNNNNFSYNRNSKKILHKNKKNYLDLSFMLMKVIHPNLTIIKYCQMTKKRLTLYF